MRPPLSSPIRVGELHEPHRHPEQQSADERRMPFEEGKEVRARDHHAHRLLERGGAGGKRPAAVDRDRAQRIARSEDFEDHVLARREALEDLHAAGGDRIEHVRRRALLEDGVALLVPSDIRDRGHGQTIGRSQLPEDRRDPKQRLDFRLSRFRERHRAIVVVIRGHRGGRQASPTAGRRPRPRHGRRRVVRRHARPVVRARRRRLSRQRRRRRPAAPPPDAGRRARESVSPSVRPAAQTN